MRDLNPVLVGLGRILLAEEARFISHGGLNEGQYEDDSRGVSVW